MVVGSLQLPQNLVLMHFAEFCVAGEGVFQKDFSGMFKFVGAINGQSKFVEDFDNWLCLCLM